MATLRPTEEKANFYRLVSLLIDGGTKALRHIFDQKFPPQYLYQKLHEPSTFGILDDFKKKRRLTFSQAKELLHNSYVNSSTFDISLLVLLLRNICGLQAPQTGWGSPPVPSDLSIEADIERLHNYRNEMQHTPDTSLPNAEFQRQWKDIRQVLLRVVSNQPEFEEEIDQLYTACIDPEKEKEYEWRLKHWEQMDKQLQEQLEELTTRVETSHQSIEALQEEIGSTISQQRVTDATTQRLQSELARVRTRQLTDGKDIALLRINSGCCSLKLKSIEEMLETSLRQKMVQPMSPELKSLCSRTEIFLENAECSRNSFVETTAYQSARKALLQSGIIVLSGPPGEGKTTIAANLLLSNWAIDRCLVIRKPEDWNYIDWKLQAFDAILIDDMFGAGTTNKAWLQQWSTELDTIKTISREKKVKFVITTRQYILEECKSELTRLRMFLCYPNIETVSLHDLSYEEKVNILSSHLKCHRREVDQQFIPDCLSVHSGILAQFSGLKPLTLGFPECVSLFATQKKLFAKGPGFFESPEVFFRNLMEQLSEDENKFLALLLLWASHDGFITRSDLEKNPKKVRGVATRFGFKLKSRVTHQVKKTLDFHSGELLTYSETDGSYTFSHNVIRDMVGLVASKVNPKATLAYAKADFFMEYITVDKDKQTDRFYVEQNLYPDLSMRIIKLLTPDNANQGRFCLESRIGRTGIKIYTNTKFTVLMHEVFENQTFVLEFISHLEKHESILMEHVFKADIITFNCKLLSFGIDIEEMGVNMIGASIFLGKTNLAAEVLRSESLRQYFDDKYLTSTLIMAVTLGNADVVEVLLKAGAAVTSVELYITARENNLKIMELLLKHSKSDIDKPATGVKGNNALIIASKRRYLGIVLCLLKHGANPNTTNGSKRTPLDKAMLIRDDDICEALLKAGAHYDYKTGKLSRTPLHIAADRGLPKAVKCMLEKGANVRCRDRRGHSPIHIASMQGRANVVRVLLQHDVTLASLKASTYGRKSVIKGMTALHYAARKGHAVVVDVLLDHHVNPDIQNAFGQTPAYMAASFRHLCVLKTLHCKADLNKAEKHGFTPLHVATYMCNISIVQFLCTSPFVDVNRRDKAGKTALHVAVEKGARYLVTILTSPPNPADQMIPSKRGDIAVERSYRLSRRQRLRILQRLWLYRHLFEIEIDANAV